MKHMPFAEYPRAPWKNGRGITREIAVASEPDGESPTWRISMATISEQAVFSTFHGVERSLAVVDGPGIELTVDGVSRMLGVGDEPARFAGDSPASARPIDGATLDLNLMVDPLRAAGSVTAVTAGDHELTGSRCFVVALTDGLQLHASHGEPLVMARLDTATFVVGDQENGALTLTTHDDAPGRRAVAYLVRVSE